MKKTVIPESGLSGDALREAAAGEFTQIAALLRQALKQTLGLGKDRWVDIHSLFADRVVILEGSRFYSYPYTINDSNQVELGQRKEVVPEFNPVFREAQSGIFVESISGSKFRIRVIRAGLSGNKTLYPDAVLREASPLFDGVRVFVKSDEEHLKGKGKDFRNLIGRLSAPRFIEGKGKDSGEIQADLELLDAAEVTPKLREAVERNMADDLFGFSIDADGKAKRRKGFREALKITKVQSVDLIIEPGAGGQIIKLLEAVNTEEETDDVALRERMIEAVKKANNGSLPEGLDTENDEALEAAYREALTPNTPEAREEKPQGASDGADKPGQGGQAGTGISAEDVDEKFRMMEARSKMRITIANSKLPPAAIARLTTQFDNMDSFVEADVTAAIDSEKDYLAKFTESGHVQDLGGTVEAGEDRSEKMDKMLDAFFDPNDRSVISFKECYTEFTGDSRVTGHLQNCDIQRMREAAGAAFRESVSSSTFSNALGNAINRMVSGYWAKPGKYGDWRDLADVVPVTDFRNQERARVGGYGDLPVVAERGAYGALATPTDDVATYAVVKHGGTEDVSLEAIKNDDVGVLRRIPQNLDRAAKRTLFKFVLDFLSTNPNITDGNAVFYAGGNNLGSAALDKPAYTARRLAMMAHVEPGSNEKMDLEPAHIWVPDQLEETAYDMFVRNTNLDPDFVQHVRAVVHRVWYWTDPNNWYLSADKNELPPIEIGFLDGQEEPELFVQDNPTQGSLFANDVITYKMRHIYGGTVRNREALDGNVVP